MDDDDDAEDDHNGVNCPIGLETQALMVVPVGYGGLIASHYHHPHHYITRYVRHRHTLHVQLQTFGASLKGKLGSIVGVLINRTRRTGNITLPSAVPTIEGTSL